MAGITIPDNVRPALAAIAKYHFWILAALAPIVLVPLLFVGAGTLRGRIADLRRQIDGKFSQIQAVTGVQPHPNDTWQAAIDADTRATSAETMAEWRRFWHSQRSLRSWPTELGADFLAAVGALQPGGKLDRLSLIRYQNLAPRLVRALPALMGVADAMGEAAGEPAASGQARPGAVDAALAAPLAWNPASQKRIFDSFVWERVPNTTQVLLAQEELWVYGLFCRLLADFVKSGGATGAHDSPLTLVDELTVGFPAGVGAAQAGATQRIVMPKSVAGEAPVGEPMTEPAMEPPPGADAAAQVPWHPRFTGGDASSPEDDYRGWIYVDFTGKPLSTADLAAAPAMSMVHLMPFVLRVVIDQRQVDRLLVRLAASPVPIDVRQVRVNPAAGIGDASGGPSAGRAGSRPNDIVVELRGSVALAVQPPATPAAAGQEAAP